MPESKPTLRMENIPLPDRLPVLPLRDIVIFPNMVIPLVVGRSGTLKAIDAAQLAHQLIALVTQRDMAVEDPKPTDMFRYGVLGRIAQLMKLPNGMAKVLVEGLTRLKVKRFATGGDYLTAAVNYLHDEVSRTPNIEAAVRHLSGLFKEYVALNRQIPDEIALSVENIANPRRFADFVAIHLTRDMHQKQAFLELDDTYQLLIKLSDELIREIEILNIEHNIEGKVKDKISKSQRNYFLQEQLRAIKKELGEDQEDDLSDVLDYKKKVKKAKMPKEARQKASEEITRLENTPMLSPEATVIRAYLDWLIGVPWFKKSIDNKDITAAERILDEDHYGLEKPKDRILEHLSVLTLAGKVRGPILCLVGPPGVGKTSLGKSIARALSRQFVRVSLGGVRDEAEIRGHRRTYIGALPGRIIQSMKKAGTINPVFLLDEVDKMAMDFRGDPSAALLEVLDPEQNHMFSDHYLEVDYDLSQVLFITTANTRDAIPWPLQDRMEVIELHGYLHQEKFAIARQFLIPKQMKECGLKQGMVTFTDQALDTIIEKYTREAGVRELERCIAKVLRRSARELLTRKIGKRRYTVDEETAVKLLGVERFDMYKVDYKDKVGAVLGLAWTPTGGDVLQIEAETMRGKGTLTLTGSLGDVMQESARAALTAVRSRALEIGFDSDLFMKQEVHVHMPEGAVHKDGPSAGITVATALASAFSGRPVRGDIAMTGEVTLRGDVLPVGGLREKLMAAVRAGVIDVIIPAKNKRELSEVPIAVRKQLSINVVENIEEVLKLVLLPKKGVAKSTKPSRKRVGNVTTVRP